MSKFGFSLQAFGYRDVLGRFTKRTEEVANVHRELSREAGRLTVRLLKHYAPSKTGLFAEGIFYRTYEIPGGAEVRFYVKGEHAYLLPFLAFGTVDHIIPVGGAGAQMAKGYPLRFFWEKGPRGAGEYRYWSVHHPGTNADPFIGLARAAAEPQVRNLMYQKAKRLAWL